jgi:gluconate 5-dehydrogenase
MATCFVEAGAEVILVGRREEPLQKAVETLGPQAHYAVQDVTQTDRAASLVARAQDVAGQPVSILVNNAGIHIKKPAVDTSVDEFQQVLQTHVLAAHALTTAVLPGMLERGRGSILFTASMASYLGLPGVVAYSAAKSAYMGMVRTLAAEVSPAGVRVNGIAPGWIHSDMADRVMAKDPARKEKIIARTPMGAFGQPEDIGWAAVYLCSPAARFVTGITLPVDGGAHIGF